MQRRILGIENFARIRTFGDGMAAGEVLVERLTDWSMDVVFAVISFDLNH